MRRSPGVLAALVFLLAATTVHGETPAAPVSPLDPGRLAATLGQEATAALVAPQTGVPTALFALPAGQDAASLGLLPAAPGFGRASGWGAISRFQAGHPAVAGELAFPVKLLNNQIHSSARVDVARAAGLDGTGVIVGVADTGLDVTHPDFRNADGSTRVLWMLDFSRAPVKLHSDLESRFGLRGSDGSVIAGAVYSRADIQQILGGNGVAPTDEVGHGSHVASIAAGADGTYGGIAPKADLVIVRVSGINSDAIDTDNLLRAVEFIFNRADDAKKPAVANLSLGTDFGPHNGGLLWEQAIASYVGNDKPGHVVVAAAGNSGSIAELPVHQAVHVDRHSTMRVPVTTSGAQSGTVQVWVQFKKGATLKVGLEGPDGTWISPQGLGEQAGRNRSGYNASVITTGSGTPVIPDAQRAAAVVWAGAWPSGTYNIVLEGDGDAELNLQAGGDVGPYTRTPAGFRDGVRSGTINSPAAHPSILGVGCTMNRAQWTSQAGTDVALRVPQLDGPGGVYLGSSARPQVGDICWFSSAGPNADGIAKPEISAPGGIVVAAMSNQARPGSPRSIFTDPSCPIKNGVRDSACFQVDDRHAVSLGTSMASPAVAGAAALLLQADATLTQAQVTTLLQAGAQRFRGAAPFDDQNGAGELDVAGAVTALTRSRDPKLALPAAGRCWFTLAQSYVTPDESAVNALLELRNEEGGLADLFDPQRLQVALKVSGQAVRYVTPQRRAPGLYSFPVTASAGEGARTITVTPLFDGVAVASARTYPIGLDGWRANYGALPEGGCAAAPRPAKENPFMGLLPLGALGLLALLRRRTATTRR